MTVPKPIRVVTFVALAAIAFVAVRWVGLQWWNSRLPDTYNVMDYGEADFGGGRVPASFAGHDAGHRHTGPARLRVPRLTGPVGGRPDARFTLTAAEARVRLPSGRTVDALTFNGRIPGPELRVREGDLVEVTLRNRDVETGVSIHWHGVDVPNADDGVSGVTQNAVLPGQQFVYRFRVDQAGTFWYHTHQSSAREVRRGLFGAFVVEPAHRPARPGLDRSVITHRFAEATTLGATDEVERLRVAPGTLVRLRLVNSDNTHQRFLLGGTPFRVLAIDGTDLNKPGVLHGETLELAGGGRYDVGFTMPAAPVTLAVSRASARLVLSADGAAQGSEPREGPVFDPSTYGRPAPTPFGLQSRFDRTFRLDVGRKLGFLDGKPGLQWTINGAIYPDVPMFVVDRGDLVKVDIANDTPAVHPMHLHGHHMLVLSRDGRPVSGSPWWSDTLDVGAHERYEVAFSADNPGLWMDHCHNLSHAADGLTMHLAYAGVTTPFLVGDTAHNHPE
jgi:FtsP/CotA-like multicopper oxidase with cupredoxin domain